MLSTIVRNEWRGLMADRTLWAVSALIAVTLLFGAFNGARWSTLQQERRQSLVSEELERRSSTRAELEKIAAGGSPASAFRDPRNPAQIGQNFGAPYALMPAAPLAPLSVGQSDLLPGHYKISLESREALLAGDELENPTNLLAGSFDVAFVIVFLYPLVILALSYNLLSGEKEQGTLALLAAQPVSVGRLAAGKILARGSVAFGLTAGFTLMGAAVARVDFSATAAMTALLGYFGVTAVYGLFWFSLALLVNAFGRGSSTNAMILAGAWLTLALVIPSTVGLAAASLYPVPSRVEMIQATRSASQETSARGSQLLNAYFADHPEMAPEGEVDANDYYSRRVAIEDEVARQIAPLSERFEEQISKQQNVVAKLQYLSPSVIAQQALNDLSGTGYARFEDFQGQVAGFADEWKAHFVPRILGKTVFSSDALDELPRFAFVAEPGGKLMGRVALRGLVIGLFSALLLLGALAALRGYRIAA